MRVLSLFICLLAFTAEANAQPTALPSDYQAHYQLKSSKYKLSIKAKRVFSVSGAKASISQKASIFVASVEQTSNFIFEENACDVASQTYKYQHSILGKKKSYFLEFDHKANKIFETENKNKSSSPIDDKLYDELSYQEALRCKLKNSTDIEVGESFEYKIRTKGRTKTYQFVISAIEDIDTKLGKLKAVRIDRVRSSNKKKEQSRIWFSQEHDYLLVKLRQKDKNDTYSLDILKVDK